MPTHLDLSQTPTSTETKVYLIEFNIYIVVLYVCNLYTLYKLLSISALDFCRNLPKAAAQQTIKRISNSIIKLKNNHLKSEMILSYDEQHSCWSAT